MYTAKLLLDVLRMGLDSLLEPQLDLQGSFGGSGYDEEYAENQVCGGRAP